MTTYDDHVARAAAIVESSPLAPLRDPLLARLSPSVSILTRAAVMEELAPGASRLAGEPDLPPGFSWPTHAAPPPDPRELAMWKSIRMPEAAIRAEMSARDGSRQHPLAFLAQLDLAEVARSIAPIWRSPLPERGWLYVFHDPIYGGWGGSPKEVGGFLVVHHDGPATGLVRTKPPESRATRDWVPAACWFRFQLMLAPFWTRSANELPIDWNDRSSAGEYQSLVRAVNGGSRHHLLGFPDPIQPTPLEDQCHAVRTLGRPLRGGDDFPVESRSWTHLLQIDSASGPSDAPGWMWGDMGSLYHFVRAEDLAAGRFDRCHRIEQCS